MPALLVLAAACFGLIFLLNNLIKAIANRRSITFWETLLAFLTAIPIAVALILNYLAILPTPELDAAAAAGLPAQSRIVALVALSDPDPILDQAALLIGAILAGASLLIALIEVLRPPRLARSRGVFGVFTGLLILVSALGIPFAAAYLSLGDVVPPPSAVAGAATPTVARSQSQEQETIAPAGTLDPEAEATVDPESAERFRQLFRAVRDVLAEEIAIDEVELFTQLDAGVPLSEIVTGHGGDVREVIRRISAIMQQGIRDAVARGDIPTLQGAFLISQMETFVTIAVNSNLNELGRRFGGPTPTGTRPSLLLLLTETPIPTGPAAATNTSRPAPSATATPTTAPTVMASPTSTPTVVPSPTLARTLPPTVTPRPPLDVLLTPVSIPPTAVPSTADAGAAPAGDAGPTVTLTPLAPMTCMATTAYNLRLRALPSTESETLTTIPFNTVILLAARTADSGWWQTSYDGQTGWVDGTYLLLSQACASLPIR
ncbi:MAG: SH3 domain-containing protein [Candidatus Flexifilum sp.]